MRIRTLLLGTLTSAIVLSAESPEYTLVAEYYTGLKEVDLRAIQADAGDLGFESDEVVLGFDVDFNGDGVPDHVLVGSCGYTGSCSPRVIDGKTKRLVASLMGRPLIVHSAKINAWPVLSTYHHMSSTSGLFSTYVYDGKRYQQVSSIMLHDESVADLFKKLDAVKTIGRPANDVRNGA
jgi:hypothetical protein